ncbi:protein FAM151A [Protopterus annectens]|uniref:protein FAM151A n=1 Tax=Protopterus annectens TaxID=7888 RepID=UPI001CFA2292|nr:protein FAM151A [Protopterus annectens]
MEIEQDRRTHGSKMGCTTTAISATLVAGLIGIAIILVAVFTTKATNPDPVISFETGGDMLEYLQKLGRIDKMDGLLVTWYHAANKKAEMQAALDSSLMVLEADVNLEGLNTVNETTVPIMAHPPDIYSDNTLQEWLNAVLQSKKGIKLDFKSIKAVAPSLDILVKTASQVNINRPVWINADIVHGPNVPTIVPTVNGTRFLALIQEKFPNVTVSPGWLTLYVQQTPNKTYTEKMIHDMYELVKDVPQRVTFPVRAVMLRQAWPHFSWLLNISDRYSLTLWQGSTDPVTIEDLLFVRDNTRPEQVYYDIYDPVLSQFKEIALKQKRKRRFYPGGNLIDYIKPQDLNAMYIKWYSSLYEDRDLMSVFKDNDGGIIAFKVGLQSNKYDIPTPVVNSTSVTDLTLDRFLDILLASQESWGLYLDIKSPLALNLTLDILRQKYRDNLLYNPVWINMDVSYGRFSAPGYIEGKEFLRTINKIFPFVTLAIGWPAESLTQGYTDTLVEDMLSLCSGVWQEVSFQLKAAAVDKSWQPIFKLLESSPSYSVTIGHEHEDGTFDKGFKGLLDIQAYGPQKVFYHLPQDYLNTFFEDIITS